MNARIINYIRAGYPALYLVSPEEHRVEAELKSIVQHLSYHLLFWSRVDGLVDSESGHITQANDPLEALQAIEEVQEKTIVLLKDFHLAFDDPNPHPPPLVQKPPPARQDQQQDPHCSWLSIDPAA